MAAFIASYAGPTGQPRTVTIKAANLAEAKKLLRRRGIRAEELRPVSSEKTQDGKARGAETAGFKSIDFNGMFEKSPGIKEKAVFASKLAALVDAGVPIVRSLDLMTTQQKLPMFKRALTKVSLDVNEGIALATALRQWPKVFDQLSIAMVEAILVFLGMTIFLIPTFAGIFEDLGAELPAFTRLLVDLSALLRSSASLYAIGVILLAIWMLNRFYATHNGRRTIDRLMLKLPLFGELILMTATAQFCRIFSSLTRAGVPILMSMEISSETTGNAIISDAILASRGMVQEGVLLSNALIRQKVLPDMALNMLTIGEETGEMDKMLSKVADFYEDEVGAMVKALTSMLEPAMIVVVGGIVGSILLAMYLPMFTVFDQIQ